MKLRRRTMVLGAGILMLILLALAWAQNQSKFSFVQRPQRTGVQTIFVKAKGNLQAAINTAQPGDTINVEAGGTFAPITLPVKSGAAYIIIQSSRVAELAESVRVGPAQSSLMPKIITTQTDTAALTTQPGAHHYKFIGIEVATDLSVTHTYHLIGLGDVGSNQNTLSQVPHDLIFDRCYIHSNDGQNTVRGFMLNSAETTIINSYLSNFKAVGADSQAIASWNGPGPYKIINNYLEGAGENIIFGGSDPSIPNLVASDVEIRGNYFFKPLSWRTQSWSVKNLLELKNAQRVIVDGNTFENNWLQSQTGEAILFTPRNQDGGAAWSVVRDVQFTNNIVRHAGGGLNILGHDYTHPSEQTINIIVRNNLFDDIDGGKWGGRGEFLLMTNKADRVVIDHNTIVHKGNIIAAGSGPHTGFVFTNNLVAHNEYGIVGDGTGPGNQTIAAYFPGAVVSRNVIAGADAGRYPADNYYPVSLSAAGMVMAASGDGYVLDGSSRYRNQGTDGKDVGCDFAAILAAMTLTSSAGNTPSPTPSPTPTPTPLPNPSPSPTTDIDPSAYYELIVKSSGKALDVPGRSLDPINLIQYTINGGNNQQWQFVPVETGYYKIVSRNSGLVLDIAGGFMGDGGQSIQYAFWGGDSQRWRLDAIGDGSYKIVNKKSGLVLDVAGGSQEDGARVLQWSDHNGENQKWRLVRIQ